MSGYRCPNSSLRQYDMTHNDDIYMLFSRLHDLGLGCHVGPIFAGSFGYADEVALVAPAFYAMDKMIKVCEIFADKIGFLFNTLKSRLLFYNVDNPNTV